MLLSIRFGKKRKKNWDLDLNNLRDISALLRIMSYPAPPEGQGHKSDDAQGWRERGGGADAGPTRRAHPAHSVS